jgi:RHS repeat-associated protein
LNLQAGHREYTGHETIPSVGLVNMNGRVYDPDLGRFLSPDPNIQFVADLQSYNRYTYAANNPLKYTDPTGYFIAPEFDIFVGVVLTVASVVVCVAGTYGTGCPLAFAVVGAIYATSSAINSGAGFEQSMEVGFTGFYLGQLGGAATGAVGGSLGAQIVGGAISGAASSAIMTETFGGGRGLGTNILKGALSGAAGAAFGYAPNHGVFSQADVAEQQQGGGDDLARGDEARERTAKVNLARQQAIANGAVFKGSIGDLPVEVYGLTGDEREAAFNALKADLSADCDASRSINQALGNRTEGGGLRPLDVILVKSDAGEIGSFSVPGSNQIVVDRWDVGDIYDSARPGGRYTYERILAHELGHAALGLHDDGPTYMNNVNKVENPIMKALAPKDYNDRMSY